MWVADYSFSRPSLAALRAGGVVGVVRYLAPLSASTRPKVITPAEYGQLVGAGFGVALVFELGEHSWRAGWSAGSQHGAAARSQANGVGFPTGRPIFAAYDTDVTARDLWQVEQYQRGFNDGAGGGPQGAYGDADVLNHLFDLGLIEVGWLTNAGAWSHAPTPRAALVQHYGITVPGVPALAIDLNTVMADDWGQHNYRAPATPTPRPQPPTIGDDRMLTVYNRTTGDTGTIGVAPDRAKLLAFQVTPFDPKSDKVATLGAVLQSFAVTKPIMGVSRSGDDRGVLVTFTDGTTNVAPLAAGWLVK